MSEQTNIVMDTLERLKVMVEKHSFDCTLDHALERSGFDYVEVEESDWTQDHKYQHCEVVVEIEDRFFEFSVGRSGSPSTDWTYTLDDVCEVKKAIVTTFERKEEFVGVNYDDDANYYEALMTFPNQKTAQAFTNFMSGQGEQDMWGYGAGDEDSLEDIHVEYDYDKGDITFTERPEEG